jgi:hypothetical protein
MREKTGTVVNKGSAARPMAGTTLGFGWLGQPECVRRVHEIHRYSPRRHKIFGLVKETANPVH